jgi:DNA-binding SARP family transcriptional activator
MDTKNSYKVEPEILEVLRETIKITVNGKIDDLKKIIEDHNERHEKDMADIKPIIEAYQGFNTAGNLVKWVAGVGTAVGVLWLMIKGVLTQ